MFPAEGVQLEVRLPAVGHLRGDRGVRRRPCSLGTTAQQTAVSWSRSEDNGRPAKGSRPSPAWGPRAKRNPVLSVVIPWESGEAAHWLALHFPATL